MRVHRGEVIDKISQSRPKRKTLPNPIIFSLLIELEMHQKRLQSSLLQAPLVFLLADLEGGPRGTLRSLLLQVLTLACDKIPRTSHGSEKRNYWMAYQP